MDSAIRAARSYLRLNQRVWQGLKRLHPVVLLCLAVVPYTALVANLVVGGHLMAAWILNMVLALGMPLLVLGPARR